MKYCDACHGSFPNDLDVCPRDQGPLRENHDLVPGMTIRGKYEIADKIGEGGMAAVYRARHLAFGEIFAIKVLSRLLAGDSDFLGRFKTEAVIARKLRHPNAVHVDDLDVLEDGRPYIVMEYVEGQSLRRVIKNEGALPVARALPIARQVCAALGAAHALGIVHRDIKPDNILLVREPGGGDLAKVLDFGIAKVTDGGSQQIQQDYAPTQTGVVVGTPQYISPEQALGMRGSDIDGRADIYSLGVVLYEMLTGNLPFKSDTAMGIAMHHIQTPPCPPRELRPDLNIPQTLSDVLMKALAKDPARRFQSAAELLQALERPHGTGGPAPALTTIAPAATASSTAPTMAALAPPAPLAAPAAAAARALASRGPTSVRPILTSAHMRNAAAVSASQPPPERESSGPNRWLLTVGAVALVCVGLVALCPAPPSRPANPDTTAGEAAAPWPPPPSAADLEALAAAAPPTDEQILETVREQIAAGEGLSDLTFETAVDDGVVSISSADADPAQLRAASELASRVRGVKQVRGEVTDAGAEADASAGAEAAGNPEVTALVEDAYAKLGAGEIDSAIAKFRAALDIDPADGPARLGLTQALAAKK